MTNIYFIKNVELCNCKIFFNIHLFYVLIIIGTNDALNEVNKELGKRRYKRREAEEKFRGTAKGGRPALYSINAHSRNLNALTVRPS